MKNSRKEQKKSIHVYLDEKQYKQYEYEKIKLVVVFLKLFYQHVVNVEQRSRGMD